MATMLTDGFRSTSPTPVGLILIPPRFLNHWCAQSSCFSHARSYYSSALKQPDRDPAQACWNTAHTRGRTNRRYTLFILRREFQRTKSLPGFFAGDFALLVYGIGRGNRSSRSRITTIYARLCKLAGLVGSPHAAWQTPYEYTFALSQRFPQASATLRRLADLFV